MTTSVIRHKDQTGQAVNVSLSRCSFFLGLYVQAQHLGLYCLFLVPRATRLTSSAQSLSGLWPFPSSASSSRTSETFRYFQVSFFHPKLQLQIFSISFVSSQTHCLPLFNLALRKFLCFNFCGYPIYRHFMSTCYQTVKC